MITQTKNHIRLLQENKQKLLSLRQIKRGQRQEATQSRRDLFKSIKSQTSLAEMLI